MQGAVEWDHVSFSYFLRDGVAGAVAESNGAPVNGHYSYALKDVSVRVPAGGSSRSSGAPAPANPPWSSC